MAILTFEVKGQTLTVKSSIGKIVENSIKYLKCEIKSDDLEWNQEGLGKYLVITPKNGKAIIWPSLDEYIPAYLIQAPGFQVSIIGSNVKAPDDFNEEEQFKDFIKNLASSEYKRITTHPVFVQVSPSGEITGTNALTEDDIPDLTIIFNNIVTNSIQEIEGLKEDLYGLNKEKTLKNSIEDEIKKNQTDIEQFYFEGIVSLGELPLRDHKIVYAGDKWVASTSSGGYKHSLIKISPNLIGKKISVVSSNEVRSEMAFLEELPDYSIAPPYVEGTTLIKEIVEFEDTIPSGTSWLYISRRRIESDLEMAPVKLEIDGYDYCKGVTENIINLGRKFSSIENDYYSALELLGGAE